MFKDGYVETLVKAKTPFSIKAGIGVSVLLIMAGIGIFIFTPKWGLTFFIIGVCLLPVFFSRIETEYEYSMVNDEIEISKIVAKKSRKSVYSFTNAEVKFITNDGDLYLDNEMHAVKDVKFYDFTSVDEDAEGVYVFVVSRKNASEFVKLELDDNSIDHVNTFFKGKYKEYKG